MRHRRRTDTIVNSQEGDALPPSERKCIKRTIFFTLIHGCKAFLTCFMRFRVDKNGDSLIYILVMSYTVYMPKASIR